MDVNDSYKNFNSLLSLYNQSSLYHNGSRNTSETKNGYNFYQTQQVVFLSVLFVFIVVSNVLILVAILFSKNRKSRMNFFIVHLAIADLSMGLIVVLTDTIWRATVEWYGGNAGCKIIKYLQSTATFASTYVLVALSIDRVNAIVRPLESGTSRGRRLLIIGAWLTALFFSIPMLFLPKLTMKHDIRQCQIEFPQPWHWQLYLTILAAMVFIAPAVVIAICYTIIVIAVWKKGSVATGSMATKTTINRSTTVLRRRGEFMMHYSMRRAFAASASAASAEPETQLHFESRSSSRGVIPKAKIKTIKMTLVIVLVFIMCWSPFIVYNLLFVYGFIPNMQQISIFIQSLVPLNSAANPIIFCIFSTRECQMRRLNWSKVVKFWKWFSCLRRSAASSGLRLGARGPQHSTFSGITSFTGPGADRNEQAAIRTNRRLRAGIANTGARRHSATPYVKGSLNEIENEILLKHICGPRQATGQDSDEVTTESG